MSEVIPFELSKESIREITNDVQKYLSDSSPDPSPDSDSGSDANTKPVPGALIHVLIPLLDGNALLGFDERVELEVDDLNDLDQNANIKSVASFHHLSVVVLDGCHWVLSTSGGVRRYRKGLHP